MFKRISEMLNVDLKGVPAIGDSLRDLQAARCRRLPADAGADRQGRKTRKPRASCRGHAGIRGPVRSGRLTFWPVKRK
jgi:histidinol phosphatase-like enzyme